MTEARNIHQRLAAVMQAVSYVQKEKKAGMNYTITSHDKVTALVRPALLAEGIVYYPVRCEYAHSGNRAECAMTVRFVNIDEPSDFFDVPTFGYGVDSQDKGPGKAMSYAVKYALLKALGLETGDDPEHESVPYTREDPAKVDPEAEWFKGALPGMTTPDHINAVLARAKAAGPEVSQMVLARAKALGMTFDKAAGGFVAPADKEAA